MSTDVTDTETALLHAVSDYTKKGFPVTIINRRKYDRRKKHRQKKDRRNVDSQEIDCCEIEELFFWNGRNYNAILQRDFKEKLLSTRKKFESEYNIEYELLLDMIREDLLPSSLDKFTKYNNKLGVQALNQIVSLSSSRFFDKNSLFVEEFYYVFERFTKGICIWEPDAVFNDILHVMTQEFCYGLENTLPIVKIKHVNEMEYVKFLQETSFNVFFAKYCSEFFSMTARQIFKRYLTDLFIRMEELL